MLLMATMALINYWPLRRILALAHPLILKMLLLQALDLALLPELALLLGSLILLEWKLLLVQFLEVLLASKLLLLKLVPLQALVPLLPLLLLVLIKSLALVAAQGHFGKHLDPGFPSKILGLTTQFILSQALIL